MYDLLKDPYVQGFGIVALLGVFFVTFYDAFDWLRDSSPMSATYNPGRRQKNAGGDSPNSRRGPFSSGSGQGGSGSRQSTPTLDAWMDPESGAMSANIQSGPFSGQRIEDLSEPGCRDLLAYCRRVGDSAAARFVETWLRRRFPGVGDGEDHAFGHRDHARPPPPSDDGPLGRDEALATLGLGAGASKKDILRAYRALIMKHHPDHGGSTAKAARINQAKDVLLRG